MPPPDTPRDARRGATRGAAAPQLRPRSARHGSPGAAREAGRAHRQPKELRTRDGRIVPFDESRIEAAVARAAREVGRSDDGLARRVAGIVTDELAARFGNR